MKQDKPGLFVHLLPQDFLSYLCFNGLIVYSNDITVSLALNTTLSTSKMVSTCLLNQWINCKLLQIVFGSNRTINHKLNNYGKVYVTISPCKFWVVSI